MQRLLYQLLEIIRQLRLPQELFKLRLHEPLPGRVKVLPLGEGAAMPSRRASGMWMSGVPA